MSNGWSDEWPTGGQFTTYLPHKFKSREVYEMLLYRSVLSTLKRFPPLNPRHSSRAVTLVGNVTLANQSGCDNVPVTVVFINGHHERSRSTATKSRTKYLTINSKGTHAGSRKYAAAASQSPLPHLPDLFATQRGPRMPKQCVAQ